jgi:hypothetical protein
MFHTTASGPHITSLSGIEKLKQAVHQAFVLIEALVAPF